MVARLTLLTFITRLRTEFSLWVVHNIHVVLLFAWVLLFRKWIAMVLISTYIHRVFLIDRYLYSWVHVLHVACALLKWVCNKFVVWPLTCTHACMHRQKRTSEPWGGQSFMLAPIIATTTTSLHQFIQGENIQLVQNLGPQKKMKSWMRCDRIEQFKIAWHM